MTSREAADYLFISHATEDSPLCDWLALKLTALGYKVWYDRFDLLGGERFSRDITTAINGAFRLLAVVSRVSKEKENPVKEWTAAINIGREHKTDFLIPIMVEDMSPTELPWQLSDVTWIPFSDNWATGLHQLVDKLEKLNAPKTVNDGTCIARSALTENNTIGTHPEVLHSNIIRTHRIPPNIHRFEVSRTPSPPESDWIAQNWPVFWIGKEREQCLSFQLPPAPFSETTLRINWASTVSWQDMETIGKIKTENIVSNLLKKSIEVKCLQKGLKRDDKGFFAMRRSTGKKKVLGPLYFPSGLLKKNKATFTQKKRKRWVLVSGQRTRLGTKFLYYLSPGFVVRQDLLDRFSVVMRVRVLTASKDGEPFTPRKALSCRKYVCKSWWNDQWLSRYLAIMEFLSDKEGRIVVGTGSEAVEFLASFASFETNFGINEDILSSERTEDEERFLEAILENDEEVEEIDNE